MDSKSQQFGNAEGMDEIPDRWLASIALRDLDYEAQLAAIRSLLAMHREADENLVKATDEIRRCAEQSSGLPNEHAIDELIERWHASVYQDAAHSMAAVGMLGPLFESLFTTA